MLEAREKTKGDMWLTWLELDLGHQGQQWGLQDAQDG